MEREGPQSAELQQPQSVRPMPRSAQRSNEHYQQIAGKRSAPAREICPNLQTSRHTLRWRVIGYAKDIKPMSFDSWLRRTGYTGSRARRSPSLVAIGQGSCLRGASLAVRTSRPMWKRFLLLIMLAPMLISQDFVSAQANPANRVSEFKLANGLTLVVVPDNRAPGRHADGVRSASAPPTSRRASRASRISSST